MIIFTKPIEYYSISSANDKPLTVTFYNPSLPRLFLFKFSCLSLNQIIFQINFYMNALVKGLTEIY